METKTDNMEQDPVSRNQTTPVYIGSVGVGGSNPIRVQSMTNTDTRDTSATLQQINSLYNAGCEIVRIAVPDQTAARNIDEFKQKSPLPLIADIHFDHKLAVTAITSGIDGIRINPGNIGTQKALDNIVDALRERSIPVRIGVNSGSVERDLLRAHNGPTPEAMVESALRHIRLLEDRDYTQIKISIKSSSVMDTLQAYQLLSQKVNHPLHLGITEAGTLIRGTVKSSVGLGILLYQGLGDTIRVSLTGDPVDEVLVAWEILRSLGIRKRGPEIISCPTCGRTEIDLLNLTREVEKYLQEVQEVFTVAVMGCPVNGPGEAKHADIGIAGGKECGIIFRKGEVIKKVSEAELLTEFKKELNKYLDCK